MFTILVGLCVPDRRSTTFRKCVERSVPGSCQYPTEAGRIIEQGGDVVKVGERASAGPGTVEIYLTLLPLFRREGK